MDQRGLDHHGFIHHDHQSLHDQHFGAPPTRPPNKISLRSLSKSDPHLNIPHLLLAQDDEHPSLNKIVSGLSFHPDSLLNSVHHLSNVGSMAQTSNNGMLRPSESSSNLLREDPRASPTLRKSSSAINWSSILAADTNKGIRDTANWSNYDQQHIKAHTPDYVQGLALTRDSDHLEGGLVMSSSSDTKMSVLATAMPSQHSFSQGLSATSASSQLGGPTGNPLQLHDDGHDRKGPGVFGNMFRQGFFSRPVVRSEEEQYRYLMALDR